MYDVVIIGAGPAGTAAGYRLARAGRRVLILDRRRFPRKKACAGGITPKAMALFSYDISHLVRRTCRRVKITRPGGASFMVKDSRPLCHMVQRNELDLYSLQKALDAGAGFSAIDTVSALEQTASHVRLSIGEKGKKKVLSARFVIGADGANSLVRRLLMRGRKTTGLPSFQVRKYPALEADLRGVKPRDYPMEFDFSRGIPGYYWIFPRDDHVNIGIYATSSSFSPSQSLLADYARQRFGHDRLVAVKGYPIGVGRLGVGRPGFGLTASGLGRVLLAGDAAGLAEPLLGEGIYAALKSGALAAQAVDHTLGACGGSALVRYHRSLSGLRLDLGLYHLAAGIMYRFPKTCLTLARHSFVHRPFSRGYAEGRSLNQILFPF